MAMATVMAASVRLHADPRYLQTTTAATDRNKQQILLQLPPKPHPIASRFFGDVSADVQKIIDRGVLKVGCKSDVPNFSLQNTATGEYEGFEDDLAYEHRR